MSIGPWQIAIIALVLIVLFGRGKVSALMGDVGRGIREFKSGLKTEETQSVEAETKSESKSSE